jgi:hypothetical protein
MVNLFANKSYLSMCVWNAMLLLYFIKNTTNLTFNKCALLVSIFAC